MTIQACPTDVVSAPAERVWELFVRPDRLAQWTKCALEEGPRRPVTTGERFAFRKGPFHVRYEVVGVDAPRELALDIHLPFGVLNHEVVRITPLGSERCRVTLN